MLESVDLLGDEVGAEALENRLIPEIDDFCWGGGIEGGLGALEACCAVAVFAAEGLSLILRSADGEGKFVSLLNVLTEELSQLTPELTDLPLLNPLELEVRFPNPLIC